MGDAYTNDYYDHLSLSTGWFSNGEQAYYGGEGRSETLYVYKVSASFYHGVDHLPKPIPEPSTLLCFGIGLLGIIFIKAKRKKMFLIEKFIINKSLRPFSTYSGGRD